MSLKLDKNKKCGRFPILVQVRKNEFKANRKKRNMSINTNISVETVQNYVETVFRAFLTVFHFFYDFPFKKGRDLKYRVEFTKYRFTIFLYRFNPKELILYTDPCGLGVKIRTEF